MPNAFPVIGASLHSHHLHQQCMRIPIPPHTFMTSSIFSLKKFFFAEYTYYKIFTHFIDSIFSSL